MIIVNKYFPAIINHTQISSIFLSLLWPGKQCNQTKSAVIYCYVNHVKIHVLALSSNLYLFYLLTHWSCLVRRDTEGISYELGCIIKIYLKQLIADDKMHEWVQVMSAFVISNQRDLINFYITLPKSDTSLFYP